jgi:hypothetical protein
MADQETYLQESGVWTIAKRGFKKLLTEMTSVKFLLLTFVCLGIWQKFISDSVGLGAALLLVGLREVPIDQIMEKLTGGIK